MLKPTIIKAINEQINAELYSSYLYLAIAAALEEQGFSGFSSWFEVQAEEEREHAMKFYHYLQNHAASIELMGIAQPKGNWKDPLAAFKAALEHEKHVTSLIHNLMALAVRENDWPTRSLLDWFVNEQVEEEANATKAVDTLTMAGDSKGTLLMLDHQYGKRSKD